MICFDITKTDPFNKIWTKNFSLNFHIFHYIPISNQYGIILHFNIFLKELD
jgi:hypothetical protein